jgi:hypothetical protein
LHEAEQVPKGEHRSATALSLVQVASQQLPVAVRIVEVNIRDQEKVMRDVPGVGDPQVEQLGG